MGNRIAFFLTAYNKDFKRQENPTISADFSKSTKDTPTVRCHPSGFQKLCGISRHYCRKQMYFYGNHFNTFDIVL